MIKVKGLQVAPAELEGHLITHPDVADAAVVGVPDDFAGELPFAFVVLHQESAKAAAESDVAAAALKNSIFQVSCRVSSSFALATQKLIHLSKFSACGKRQVAIQATHRRNCVLRKHSEEPEWKDPAAYIARAVQNSQSPTAANCSRTPVRRVIEYNAVIEFPNSFFAVVNVT